ncbi:YitT family protein [Clostridioides difficile]|nr:YitT family protein [Clostridioides difficile]
MARRLFLERIGLIFLGSAILAFGVYNFYYLNNITEGGVLGILLLLKNLFNIQPAIANVVIDGLLLLVGYKFFGKKFLIYSIVASITFSVLYDLFEAIGPLVPQSQNMLLSTVLAGVTVGIGVGIVVKAGCASGGDDALALVISKTTSLNIGQVYLATDVIVLLLSLFYLSAFDIFYSLIAVTISGKVIDFIYYHGKSLDMDISNDIVPEC